MHANSELQKFYIGIEFELDKIKASIITMIFPMALIEKILCVPVLTKVLGNVSLPISMATQYWNLK